MGANFNDRADFTHADFNNEAYFTHVHFIDKADFSKVIFIGMADFYGADFNDIADFTPVKFKNEADFTDANFNDMADFESANFNDRANFCGAFFNDKANFCGAYFNDETNFMDSNFASTADFLDADFCDRVYFSGATYYKINLTGACFKEDIEANWDSLEETLVCDGAVYIKLIKSFRNNEQFEDANRVYYIYRKDSQSDKSISLSKLGDIIMWISCGYGVKPGNAIVLSFFTVSIFALFYWKGNGIKYLKWPDENDNIGMSFLDAFYFSVVTFTTIGYGDWYPTGKYRLFVMLEGILGWLLLALFLVTLTNIMIKI